MDQVKNVAIARRTSRFERVQRRFRIMLTVAFGAIACAVAIVALRSRITFPTPVVRYDPSMMVRVAPVERVFAVRPDPGRNGRLWFASAQGLYEYDTVEASWRRWDVEDGLGSPVVYDVCFGRGAVWAATEKGLAVRDSGAPRFRAVADTSEATAICGAGDSLVVAFTRGQGLVVYGPETAPHPLSVVGLRPTHAVTCLRYSNGAVLIGTDMEELFAWNSSNGTQRQFRLIQ